MATNKPDVATNKPDEKVLDSGVPIEAGPRNSKAGNELKPANTLLGDILAIKESGWAVLIALALAAFGMGWECSQWIVVDRRDETIRRLTKENADLAAKVGIVSDSAVVLPPTIVAEHHAVTTKDGECQIKVDTAGDGLSRIYVIVGTAAPVELNVVPGERKVVGPYYIDILANNFTNLEITVSKRGGGNPH